MDKNADEEKRLIYFRLVLWGENTRWRTGVVSLIKHSTDRKRAHEGTEYEEKLSHAHSSEGTTTRETEK